MKRIDTALRSSVALAALMMAGTAAQAQSTLPPADVTQAPAAAASTQPTPAGEIVVTGSRIRRNPLNQDSPIVYVDQQDIAKTGLSAIADVLQRLPGASGGLNQKVNNSGNLGNPPDGGGVGAGSATIDLRYLGANRTLVLVDGLRFVNATAASGIPGTVDLNTIPANMIDRIEVLQAGASPLYGSDAIAGVVNIITVAQQEGLRASAQYGQFRQGDGKTVDLQASYGIKLPTTNIVFGASYVKQKAVRSGDRDISQFPNPGQTSCTDPVGGCSSAAANGRFLTFMGSQTIHNGPNDHPTLADLVPFTSADRFNFAPFNYILTPSERYGGWVSIKQELTSDINLRIKGLYNRRNSQNQAAFEPLFIGPDAGNGAGSLFDTLSFDATNPFNPFGVTLESGLNPNGTPNGKTPNYSFIARRLIEAGQRTFNQKVDTYSATATLDGKFQMFGGHDWYWDANALFGINKAKQSFTGNVRADRVAQAIGPIANCTAPCVPLNLFGGLGSITPAMLDWIAFTEHDKSHQHLFDYTANVSGTLTDLPAGPLDIAIGYEHRLQSAAFTPDPIVSAGLGADIPAQPSHGKYHVDEVYGEIRVPILKDTPGFYSLEANGALRHSKYSISGSATTYTINGDWKPVRDFLIRGSYSTGFRAPTIGELFGGRSRFDLPVVDPCSNIPGSPYQASAAVRANCTANGTPASGSYAEPPGQLPVITQGNENLKPEKSTNLTFGGVFSPRLSGGFASAFSLQADYHDIKVKNAIGAVDPNLTLNNCALLGDAASCALVKRTANGFVNEIDGTLQNLDSIRTKGIDAALAYRSPATQIGKIGLSVNASWLLKYVLTASNGFVVLNRRGTERGSPDQAFPKFKGNATLDWAMGDFGASFTGRYIDAVTEIDSNTGLPHKLKSKFYGDVQFVYTPSIIDRRVQLTLGVNNVFDTDPPPCVSCSLNNYDPTTYDVPGQFGYVRLSYKM
jgi:iron complex outermembrane receptor protein